MEIVSKLLGLINKPTHFFMLGLLFLLWGILIDKSKEIILVGLIFMVMAIASFVDFIYSHIQKIRADKKQKEIDRIKKEQDELILKGKITDILTGYEELQGLEKQVIEHCLVNNSLSFKPDVFSLDTYHDPITSLNFKGFGARGSNAMNFIFDREIFLVLKEYTKKESDNDNAD